MNICVIGGGFVGLVTAAGFAHFGHSVVCVEKNLQRLDTLRKGQIPFYEKDLEDLINKNVKHQRLLFSNDLVDSIKGQQIIFITVGTPSSKIGRANLLILEGVVGVLSKNLTKGQIVVLKSTVPVGTGSHIQKMLNQNNNIKPIVNNPEFLSEGSAVYDFFNPRRIILGSKYPDAIETVINAYQLGIKSSVSILTTDNKTAEMIKYASNAFLTTKIGFINELAGLCDKLNVNVLEVTKGMGLDPRVGTEFLNPGPGWGGSCFRKDITEFIGLAKFVNHSLLIASAALKANEYQYELVIKKIEQLVKPLNNVKIGILGLAFKADTSDMRDSASIPIIKRLLEKGAKITAYDPKANKEAASYLPNIKLVNCAYDVAKQSNCLVILTAWQEFQKLDFKYMATLMNSANMIDTRNLLTLETARHYGFNYIGMGQGNNFRKDK